MSLNPNATATVFITGLALCRQKNNNWEALFIHPENTKHILKIWIDKFDLSTGQKTEEVLPKIEIQSQGKITITTEDSRRPPSIEYNNGDFGVEMDFCWAINLNNLHPEGITMIEDQHLRTSHLSIFDSTFYTSERTRKKYKLQQQGNPHPREIRRIGDVIGADIECLDNGKIIVEIQGHETRALSQENGFRYHIYLANTCQIDDCGREIDFKYYYDFLTPNSGNPFDLDDVNDYLRNDEAACNPVKGDPECDLERYFQTGKCS